VIATKKTKFNKTRGRLPTAFVDQNTQPPRTGPSSTLLKTVHHRTKGSGIGESSHERQGEGMESVNDRSYALRVDSWPEIPFTTPQQSLSQKKTRSYMKTSSSQKKKPRSSAAKTIQIRRKGGNTAGVKNIQGKKAECRHSNVLPQRKTLNRHRSIRRSVSPPMGKRTSLEWQRMKGRFGER